MCCSVGLLRRKRGREARDRPKSVAVPSAGWPALARAPRLEVQKLAPGPRTISYKTRIRVLDISESLLGEPVGAQVLLEHILGNRVDPKRVAPENLGAQRRRDLGIAVFFGQLVSDLEHAKRLDLVLR